MKNLRITILSLLVSFFLTGCYTQLAMRASYYDDPKEEKQYDEDEYYETQEDTLENEDETYYDDDTYYDEDNNVIYERYYLSPNVYHRYYWGYYPSISFGIHFGYSYYDPYCWDPFYDWYWPWCGSYYYYPYYSYYYHPVYYYPYFYYSYPYYGGYWSSNHSVYRERNKSGFRLRNNDGLRSGYTTRGTLTRGNNRVSKDLRNSQSDNIRFKNPTRNTISDRTSRTQIKGKKNESLIERRTDRNKNIIRNKTIEKQKNSARELRKNTTKRKYDSNNRKPVYNPKTNRNKQPESKSGVRQRTTKPPKTYSPPKRTYNPPKSYSPPRRSSSPPRSSSGSDNRSGGSRGGNNSGGRRTR